jgi:arylsulfatase A-like enzyme
LRWPTGLISAARSSVRTEPVELRDILPTFLQAAEAPSHSELDGRSLLDLAAGKSANWRPWIDLEHNICYDAANNWNALTDGKQKYIFHARDGEEQFFDLASDPSEFTDLAGNAASDADLRRWRGRMLDHLSERGECNVAGGKLAVRPKGIMTSPHFPGYPKNPLRPGTPSPF